MPTRLRALQCHIEPVLFYGSETWTIGTKDDGEIKSNRDVVLENMFKTSWTEKEHPDRSVSD